MEIWQLDSGGRGHVGTLRCLFYISFNIVCDVIVEIITCD